MAGDVDLNQRELLLAALLRGENHSQAARSSGYSRKHVKELVRQPSFLLELTRRQEAQDRLLPPRQADPDEDLALEHLRAIVVDESKPAAARVAAAKELRAAARDRRAPRVTTTASRTGPKADPEGETRPAAPARSVADEAAAFGIRIAK